MTMARYQEDYGGIAGDLHDHRGMDPNHRGGYQGMRMHAGQRQAAYGWHRWTHPRDFHGSGGFDGRYSGDYDRSAPRRLPSHGYDREIRGAGGVYDLVRDPEHLRMFNSDSIRFRDEGQGAPRRQTGNRYENDYRGSGAERSPAPRGYDSGLRRAYGNRGINEAGYGEAWAWGPMRGSR